MESSKAYASREESKPDSVKTDLMAMEMRVRLLETLVAGSSTVLSNRVAGPSAVQRANDAVKRLNEALEVHNGEPVRRFIEHCATTDLHLAVKPLNLLSADDANYLLLLPLLPSEATAGSPEMTAHAKASLILESENDIRATERELRELEALDRRGLAGAGHLAGETLLPYGSSQSLTPCPSEHEQLKPQLDDLLASLPALVESYAQTEDRVTRLLNRYNEYVRPLNCLHLPIKMLTKKMKVDTVSQIFIAYNAIVSNAEEVLSRLERAE